MNTYWNNLSFPRVCALLASKPSKLSQAMHNAGFKSLGLDFFYTAIKTENTAESISAVRELGFRGISLTIPHKEVALSIVDEVEAAAKKIGAINTVINTGEKLHGFNTDCYGISKAIEEAKFDLKKEALIIGAGGASRAAVYALQKIGISKITVCNRTIARAEQLAKEFNLEVIKVEEIESNLENKILINSTPNESIFNYNKLEKSSEVFDMITKETLLIKTANQKKCRTIDGRRMLLFQAIKQFELFTEQTAPIEVMEKALYAQL